MVTLAAELQIHEPENILIKINQSKLKDKNE